MPFSKVTIFVLVFSVAVFADWDSTDKNRLSTISGNVGNIESFIHSNIGDSFTRFNNVTMMGSDGYGVMNPWLLQMAYGVELSPSHVGGSNEHWNLNPNVPTNDYLTAFGLKSGYEDNTQNYLDYIRQFNKYKNYYPNGYLENGNDTMIDNWLAFSYGMDVMNKLDEANFNDSGTTETKTQSAKINDTVVSSVSEADNLAKNLRVRLLAVANNSLSGSTYTGDVLELNFAWLHGFLQNCANAISRNQWTVNVPWMLQRTYVFTLRPQQNNLLYPLFHAWQQKRSYIDVVIAFICYFSVMAFIVSRVYVTLTK